MANARRCDRCGNFYDPFEAEGVMCKFLTPIFQNSNDVREGVVARMMNDCDPDTYQDLCPQCSEAFEAFMDGCDICTWGDKDKVAKLKQELETSEILRKRYCDELYELQDENGNVYPASYWENKIAKLEQEVEDAYLDTALGDYMDRMGFETEEDLFSFMTRKMADEFVEDAIHGDPEKIKRVVVDILRGVRDGIHERFGRGDRDGDAVCDGERPERENEAEHEVDRRGFLDRGGRDPSDRDME